MQPRQDRTQRMPCRSSFPVDKPEHGRKWQGRPSLVRLVDSPNAFPSSFFVKGVPRSKETLETSPSWKKIKINRRKQKNFDNSGERNTVDPHLRLRASQQRVST